jgi:hypothetical protein
MTVVQSVFQADSTLAASINHNNAEIIFSADSDLAALLGDKCVAIKKYSFIDKARIKIVKDIELFSADMSTIKEICDSINLPVESIVIPKKPVFEGITEMKVRCLIAVGIGCDVYIPGVPSVTAKVICEIINKMKSDHIPSHEYYNVIMEKYIVMYTLFLKKNYTVG